MPILTIALLVVFGIGFVVQMYYLWGVFSRFAFHRKSHGESGARPPVSVVISARNEYLNLKNNLPKILEQDYPRFEVVVVNDFSDDDTGNLLDELQKKYKHLRIFTLSQHLNFFQGKKFPLALGIKSTEYEHLLLTDADCEPASEKWINEMMKGFEQGCELVLGYGAYRKQPGFVNTLVRFETVRTAIQYFSFAIQGKPYMGVGRNLAYLKSVFYRAGGFSSHYKIASGDDDLFVNKIAEKQNTCIVYAPESHTVSQPKTSFAAWSTQKRRHLSTGRHYKKADKYRLGGYVMSRLLFYAGLIILLIVLPLDIKLYGVGAALVYFVSQWIVFQRSARRLNEGNVGWLTPVLELFFVIWEPVLALLNMFSKKNTWK